MYIYVWGCRLMPCLYSQSAWAGLTLLILMRGQCEGLKLGMGARETLLPRLFLYPFIRATVSIIKNVNRVTVSRGVLTGGIVCAFLSEIETI